MIDVLIFEVVLLGLKLIYEVVEMVVRFVPIKKSPSSDGKQLIWSTIARVLNVIRCITLCDVKHTHAYINFESSRAIVIPVEWLVARLAQGGVKTIHSVYTEMTRRSQDL